MKLYTTYFANLRNLPDCILPIRVSLGNVANSRTIPYPKFFPKSEDFKAYKCTGDFQNLKYNYAEKVLAYLNPEAVLEELEELSGGRDIAFVCFEKDPMSCHRSFIAEWFNIHGIECEEVKHK